MITALHPAGSTSRENVSIDAPSDARILVTLLLPKVRAADGTLLGTFGLAAYSQAAARGWWEAYTKTIASRTAGINRDPGKDGAR